LYYESLCGFAAHNSASVLDTGQRLFEAFERRKEFRPQQEKHKTRIDLAVFISAQSLFV
jgi:hypothetical protein